MTPTFPGIRPSIKPGAIQYIDHVDASVVYCRAINTTKTCIGSQSTSHDYNLGSTNVGLRGLYYNNCKIYIAEGDADSLGIISGYCAFSGPGRSPHQAVTLTVEQCDLTIFEGDACEEIPQ